MRRPINFFVLLAMVSTVVFFSSCESESERGNARLQIWLTDNPGDFDQVNVDIKGVQVHSSSNENEGPWTELDTDGGVINLLELTNGFETLLADQEIPSGRVSQIRLVLGENNTVMVDSTTHDLVVPSGSQSGLKVQIHENLLEGVTYKIVLDFDVARSVVKTGASTYILKPVLRTIIEAESGAIKGIVEPAESTPAVFAIQDGDTITSAFTDVEGNFLLRGIPEGIYTVTFEPTAGYAKLQVEEVSVETGGVTDMGTVSLPQQ